MVADSARIERLGIPFVSRALRAFLGAGLLFILSAPVFGAFLHDYPSSIRQPDGTVLNVLLSGDEYYNWVTDTDGFVIMRDPDSGYCVYAARNGEKIVPTKSYVGRENPRLRGIAPRTLPSESFMRSQRARRPMPARRDGPQNGSNSGTLNNIVIYIRFSDETEYTTPSATYDAMFNGAAGTNSLRNYYTEASYGKLTINTSFYPTPAGSTVASFQDTHPRSYYQPYDQYVNAGGYRDDSERTVREQTLLQSAVAGVASQIPAGMNVDSDGDGNVDNVCFVVKGSPGAWSTLLWPHMWELYTVTATINGKRVWNFNFQLEDVTLGYSSAATGGPGVLCHEMFHSLGAPDLYHYSGDGMRPAGKWDLMENNTNPPQHMSAYMKWKYGHWIDSIPTITATGDYNVYPLTSSTQNCFKVQSPMDPNEFFVLEYRRNDTGLFEKSLPDTGLLVWRINTAAGDGNAGGPPDEAYVYRPGGTLFANGTPDSAAKNSNNNPNLNGVSNPACFLWDGSQGGLDCSALWPKYMAYMPVHVNIADPTKHLAFLVQPGEAKAGTAITPAPQVAVMDASGSVVTGYSGSVTAYVGPTRTGVSISGVTTAGFVNGVATLSGLSVNKLGSCYLTAASTGIASLDSARFNIVADSYRSATSVKVGSYPWGISVNPVTNRVYVSTVGDSTVTVLDGASNTIVARIYGFYYPRGIAVYPAANKIYVVNQGYNWVSVIDGSTNQVTKTIGVGNAPWGCAFNPQTNRLYVGNRNDSSLSVIDCVTDTLYTTITGVPCRTMLAVNPTTNRVFVPNNSDNLVRVVSGSTNTVTGTISGIGSPNGVAVDTTLDRLYVSDTATNQIDSYVGTTLAYRTKVTVGTFPYGACANPSTGHLFQACQMTDDVAVVDGNVDAVLAPVSEGSQPISIAVNPVTNRAYVANWISGTVSVIQDNPSGSALHLEFTTQPGTTGRGIALTTQPVVAVKDASGAIVSTYSGKIGLVVQPDGAGSFVGGSSTVDVINGQATFTDISLLKPGRFTLRAFSGALTPATSAPFRITPTIIDVILSLKDAGGLRTADPLDPGLYDVIPQTWPIGRIDLLDVALLARLAAGLN